MSDARIQIDLFLQDLSEALSLLIEKRKAKKEEQYARFYQLMNDITEGKDPGVVGRMEIKEG